MFIVDFYVCYNFIAPIVCGNYNGGGITRKVQISYIQIAGIIYDPMLFHFPCVEIFLLHHTESNKKTLIL